MKGSLFSVCCNHILSIQYFSKNLYTLDVVKRFSKITECIICQDNKTNGDLVDHPSHDSFENVLSRAQESYKYKDNGFSDFVKRTLNAMQII